MAWLQEYRTVIYLLAKLQTFIGIIRGEFIQTLPPGMSCCCISSAFTKRFQVLKTSCKMNVDKLISSFGSEVSQEMTLKTTVGQNNLLEVRFFFPLLFTTRNILHLGDI